jgi:WD40 repeat protein
MTRTILLPLAALMATALPASAAEPDFYRDVYPFLKTNCISCHNKTTTKADLNMESPELMIKGGESGPSVVPGKSAESLVVQASLHQHDMEMPPPKNKSGAQNLTQAEVSILKLWIDQGARSSVQQERAVAWRPLAAGVHPIYSVAMTKDGRYAACGRSNLIFVYDLATRQLVAQVSDPAEKSGAAHRALVQSLAFSPDGTRLASGSFREVKIWRLGYTKASDVSKTAAPRPAPANEAVLKKISEAAKTGILSHSMSGDGKRIVTGCADGSVRVWDTASLKPVIELRGSVASRQKSAELEWTVAAQSLEQAFQKSETTRIEAQNKALGELLKKANEAILAMKKVLPEKQKAVQPATVAKAAAQKEVDDAMTKVKASPGGKPDAALDKELKAAQNKLITAKIAERSVLAAVSAAENNVKDADEDVKRITGTKTKNAKLLAAANAAADAAKKIQEKAAADLAALKQAIAKSTAKPLAVTFSGDALRVAAMFDDGALRVWAVATGAPIEEKAGNSSPAITLVPGADGSFTATKASTVSIGGAPQWTLERTLGGEKQHGLFADRVNAVCFSPDGKTLATGGGEPTRAGDIILFDAATGKATQTWKERHADAVLGLDFSPDGKLLASGAADKLAKVTDIATGKQVNLFEGHTHHVMDVAFRADGRVLATAGADGVVLTWDMISGERKKKIEGWTKEVTSLQFIGATNQIVTSAGDNRVRVVTDEGAEIRSIAGLPDYMQASQSTPDGGTIIGGGEDSFLRVWDGSNGKELAAFGGK